MTAWSSKIGAACKLNTCASLLTSGLHTAIHDAIESEEYKKGLFLVQRLIELDPLDEWAHRQGMLLYALDGQRGLSLEQFAKCRAVLQAELGVEPSPETKQLHEKIIQGTQPLYNRAVIPPHNLPAPQTSFIGRQKELAQIASLLRDPACRLLTLVGPGGIGKTRLALQAASKVLRYLPGWRLFHLAGSTLISKLYGSGHCQRAPVQHRFIY